MEVTECIGEYHNYALRARKNEAECSAMALCLMLAHATCTVGQIRRDPNYRGVFCQEKSQPWPALKETSRSGPHSPFSSLLELYFTYQSVSPPTSFPVPSPTSLLFCSHTPIPCSFISIHMGSGLPCNLTKLDISH